MTTKNLTTDDVVAFVRRELADLMQQGDQAAAQCHASAQATIDSAAERAGACSVLALLCIGRDQTAVRAIQDETHIAVLRLLRQSRSVCRRLMATRQECAA